MGASMSRWIRRSPGWIVVGAWLGALIYGNPGYLPAEAVHRLLDARAGHYRDLSAVLWRVLEVIVPGPFAMLVLQTGAFALGAHLLLRTLLTPRAAAVVAAVTLWFPPVLGTLTVLTPEALAIAGLMFGAGMLRSPQRARAAAGLVITAMAASLLPWGPLVAVPLALVRSEERWRVVLAGAALSGLLAAGLSLAFANDGRASLRAETGSQAYVWFSDLADRSAHGGLIQHDARASGIQELLQPAMRWLGRTPLFDPRVYAVLALLLVPMVRRDRPLLALLGSGLAAWGAAWLTRDASELRTAPSVVAVAVLAGAVLIARRVVRRDGASSS